MWTLGRTPVPQTVRVPFSSLTGVCPSLPSTPALSSCMIPVHQWDRILVNLGILSAWEKKKTLQLQDVGPGDNHQEGAEPPWPFLSLQGPVPRFWPSRGRPSPICCKFLKTWSKPMKSSRNGDRGKWPSRMLDAEKVPEPVGDRAMRPP